jgi:hypothetical protein
MFAMMVIRWSKNFIFVELDAKLESYDSAAYSGK